MSHVEGLLAEVAAARRRRRQAARTDGGTGTYQIAHSRASPRWSHHIAGQTAKPLKPLATARNPCDSGSGLVQLC